MGELVKKITKLIDVKSIVTLWLTYTFTELAKKGYVDIQQFMAIFTMIIGFYYGTQKMKQE